MFDITHIYAIGSWHGPIKFGISQNPSKRAVQIQTASPFKVDLIHSEPCDTREEALECEKFLHDHYTKFGKLVFGEWFDIDGITASCALWRIQSVGKIRALERRRLL